MIGRSGERGSGIFVLAARHDDDDIYGEKLQNKVIKSQEFIMKESRRFNVSLLINDLLNDIVVQSTLDITILKS